MSDTTIRNKVREVTKDRPCPICGRPDWCAWFPKGDAVLCARVQVGGARRRDGSLIQSKDGVSTVHRLDDAAVLPADVPSLPSRSRPRVSQADIRREAEACHDLIWNDDAAFARLQGLADALGVGVSRLMALEAGWSERRKAFTFPMFVMRGADAVAIGIRLRHEDGRKRAVPGSHNGLFFTRSIAECDDPVVIAEGPTDTAAAMDLRMTAIGRAMNVGCESEVLQVVKGRDVIVCADNDAPKPLRKGEALSPKRRAGMFGAERLASALVGRAKSVRVWCPPSKDLRAMVNAGYTPDVVAAMMHAAPKRKSAKCRRRTA